jgi:hypothetical protein
MSRARKPISPNGYTRCSKCKAVKHLDDFYIQNKDVKWFVDEHGGIWGKPASQCKECMKGYYRDQHSVGVADTPESLRREANSNILARALPERHSKPHPADDPNWLTDEDIEDLSTPRESM